MFQAAIIQMGCDSRDMSNNYWPILEQLHNVIQCNKFYHTSQFRHSVTICLRQRGLGKSYRQILEN
jgi:hypothetical protein